jgi:hypothetical protein
VDVRDVAGVEGAGGVLRVGLVVQRGELGLALQVVAGQP